MNNKLVAAVVMFLAQNAYAASEEWSFISVDRSVSLWHVRDAKGTLEHNSGTYSGRLSDGSDQEFEIHISISGTKASGTIETIPGDSGPGEYSGTYNRIETPGIEGCWETIQLVDGHNYVALRRNSPCK